MFVKNIGGHFETWKTGVSGPVVLHGLDQGKWDLSWQKWTYQVGLKGEAMNLNSPDSISFVNWMDASLIELKPQPLTWHKVWKCETCEKLNYSDKIYCWFFWGLIRLNFAG